MSGMSAWDAVRTKRAVREFADRPIADEDLDRIVRAGTRAHSSKNQQRWAFIVIRDRERLRALSETGRYAGHLAGAAAAIALVTPDPLGPGQPLSVVWDSAKAILRHPDGMDCEYIISFGYPADPAKLTQPLKAGGRKPLDEVRFEERWGEGGATDADD
jgi:hypothetical protein